MIALASSPSVPRLWSPSTRPRFRPPVRRSGDRALSRDFLTTIYVTDQSPLTLRQRLAKAIDTGILHIAGLNLAVTLFVYLLGRPSVAGYLANFLQRCVFC
jgi:hypothetical protein